ncbi:MAG: hypothetical protein H6669_15710 [Ardenticatenaceae bacterium]|nr:hypothetical protein [Ardenticatenaceae bacterium]
MSVCDEIDTPRLASLIWLPSGQLSERRSALTAYSFPPHGSTARWPGSYAQSLADESPPRSIQPAWRDDRMIFMAGAFPNLNFLFAVAYPATRPAC